MNINRDYLIINDVKKSNIKLDNGSMFFYITDKNTQNIFVNLVINVSNNELIQKYANIENAEDYTLTMNIVKPDNTYKIIEGKLHDKEKAIFEFDLNEDCCDEIGPYRCELLTKCNINGHEEITTSNKLTYKVKASVLNDLDDIVEAPEYPLVIQLFDKLSDIEQYEEDRRANELARQLAEEQRQTRFNVLDADMTDRIETIDNKLVEIDNVLISKEDIADIKSKNTEQDRRLDVAENRLDNINTNIENVLQPTVQRVDAIEAINATQNDRLDAIEAKNTQQDNRLDIAENRLANIGNDITNTMQPIIDGHTARLDAIEAIDVAQNNRLDAIEVKNQQQDDRLLDIEKVNKKQDIDIKCLYGASQTIDVTKEGNSIYLQNSNNGFTIVDEIKGNTLVNCNKEPNKELILNGNINTSGDNTVTITEGVDGGLVDVVLEGNTLVNVSKTKDSTALPLEEELTYLYANTQYTVQFVSDKATTADITLGGTQLLAQSIVAGLNRISITTPDTLVDNKLVIDGVGANISEVVVTDTDREFKYFEGMESVGECEELEVKSGNKNLFDINNVVLGGFVAGGGVFGNKITILESTNRAYTYIKVKPNTRYVFNSSDVLLYTRMMIDEECEAGGVLSYKTSVDMITTSTTNYIAFNIKPANDGDTLTLDMIKNSNIQVEEGYIATDYIPHQSNSQTLTHEPLRGVGDVKDRYVLLDGNWYIERNCGIRAYQEGDKDNYKTDLINTVYPLEMPAYDEIDYSPLEVYSGTTHITTNSAIPTNITVKNHGFNCLLKPSTTYTISSNLGLNTVTTPSTLTEDCLRFMDTDTSDITTMRDVLILEGDWTTKADLIPANFSGMESAFEQEYDAEKGKYKVNVKVANEDKTRENDITFYINEPLRGIGDVKDRVYIKDDKVVVQRSCGIRAYEDGDFGTYLTDKIDTVYPLATPTYEEVEYNDVKLFIESFKNSTLFYNGNVPVTSKLYYSYSVPIVDKVTQTASITDEQDSMIIDLATQCAVMEMMLM